MCATALVTDPANSNHISRLEAQVVGVGQDDEDVDEGNDRPSKRRHVQTDDAGNPEADAESQQEEEDDEDEAEDEDEDDEDDVDAAQVDFGALASLSQLAALQEENSSDVVCVASVFRLLNWFRLCLCLRLLVCVCGVFGLFRIV